MQHGSVQPGARAPWAVLRWGIVAYWIAPMPSLTLSLDAPFFIVLNAGSGSAEVDERVGTIRAVLDGAGRACEIEVVSDAAAIEAQARRLAACASKAGGILVAAGGDGTINTVAQQALAAGCAFGVLPQGTFNYFGRAHAIPEDLTEAVEALLHARVTPVQVGLLNQRVFLVNASVGLYPQLLEAREADKREYGRSRLVALLSALRIALQPHRHLRITLEHHGQTQRLRTTTLFIGNNRLQLEQVGMQALTHVVEQGQLVALAPRPMGRFGLLGLLVRGALGRLGGADDLIAFPFQQMTVRTPAVYGRRSLKVAADGEVFKLATPFDVRVLEDRLLLLSPAPGMTPAAAAEQGSGLAAGK